MNNIIIYSKSNCIYCEKAKELFPNATIINCDKELEINKQQFLDQMKLKIGFSYKTFPMIFINDEFIGGYDDAVSYVNDF